MNSLDIPEAIRTASCSLWSEVFSSLFTVALSEGKAYRRSASENKSSKNSVSVFTSCYISENCGISNLIL